MASLFRRRRTPPRPDEVRLWNGYSTPPGWIIRNTYPSMEGGKSVDPETALTGTIAVYACVSLLADLVGSLPLHLYRRGADDERERVSYTDSDRARGRGHPGSLSRLIGLQPNPEMTAQELWTDIVGHLALWGNAYLEVIRDGGRPKELWPLRPDRVRLAREDGEIRYYYRADSGEIPVEECMHIRAFGTDGIMGMSPITAARKTIGAEQATSEWTTRWYANGANPSAIITIPRGPQEQFKDRTAALRDGFSGIYSGVSNAGRIAVIEEGTSWQQVSMSMLDMQFVETRQFTVREIARLYRIPGWLINDVERNSWGGTIEQTNLGFLTYTLRPLLARIENAITRCLGLIPGERTLEDEKLYPEFVTADLLRADTLSRYQAYQIGLNTQIITPNEARKWENLPPREGGDEVIVPQGAAVAEDDQGPDQPAEDDALRAALITALNREPVQMQLPEVTVHSAPAPDVKVYAQDVSGEVRDAVAALAPPVIDTAPIAKIVGQAEARRIIDAENADKRHAADIAELRHGLAALAEAVAEAAKPPPVVPLKRKVHRDPKTGLITFVEDVPAEEAV